MKRIVIISKHPFAYENRRLSEEMRQRGLDVEICRPDLFAATLGTNAILTYEGRPFAHPNLILVRTGSGTGAYTAALLNAMAAYGIIIVNPLHAIQAAMDKAFTMQTAASERLPIPHTMIHTAKDEIVGEWTFGYPCIVKLTTGSRGNGVLSCYNASQLKAVVGLLKALDSNRTMLVQEYLGDRPGCDLRVLVIGGRAVGAMLRSAKDSDFRANISRGGVGSKFDLTPEVIAISEKIARLLGLQIAGVDLLFAGDAFKICEVNSSPGFRGFEAYCGLNVAGAIAEYIKTQINSL